MPLTGSRRRYRALLEAAQPVRVAGVFDVISARLACSLGYGSQPLHAAIKAAHDALKHLREGGSPAALRERLASGELLDIALRRPDYRRWQREYLKSGALE